MNASKVGIILKLCVIYIVLMFGLVASAPTLSVADDTYHIGLPTTDLKRSSSRSKSVRMLKAKKANVAEAEKNESDTEALTTHFHVVPASSGGQSHATPMSPSTGSHVAESLGDNHSHLTGSQTHGSPRIPPRPSTNNGPNLYQFSPPTPEAMQPHMNSPQQISPMRTLPHYSNSAHENLQRALNSPQPQKTQQFAGSQPGNFELLLKIELIPVIMKGLLDVKIVNGQPMMNQAVPHVCPHQQMMAQQPQPQQQMVALQQQQQPQQTMMFQAQQQQPQPQQTMMFQQPQSLPIQGMGSEPQQAYVFQSQPQTTQNVLFSGQPMQQRPLTFTMGTVQPDMVPVAFTPQTSQFVARPATQTVVQTYSAQPQHMFRPAQPILSSVGQQAYVLNGTPVITMPTSTVVTYPVHG